MKYYPNILETIGKTPLVELQKIEKQYHLKARLFAKVESFNPGASVKDRIAFAMISDAMEKGLLQPGGSVVEPTSGNTGIGLAMVGAVLGLHVTLVMPDTLSIERRKLMKAYGAELVLTDGTKGIAETIRVAREIAEQTHAYVPFQFENPANPAMHYKTTGPEIYAALDGKVDVFAAGIGTGGTVSGVGRYLKEKNPATRIVGIEPKDSPVLTEGRGGPHKIQGIGAGFIPGTLDRQILDEVVTVANEEAFQASGILAKAEGILAGISAGAALKVGIELAMRPIYAGKNIVIVLPDTGERYLSTTLFEE